MHLLLIGDGEIGLPRRDHLGRGRGVGRSDDFHVQPRILEVAELVGNDDRAMIGVRIPVENELQLVIGVSRSGSGEGEAEQGGKGSLFHRVCSRAWPA